jgi:hypothetical protein
MSLLDWDDRPQKTDDRPTPARRSAAVPIPQRTPEKLYRKLRPSARDGYIWRVRMQVKINRSDRRARTVSAKVVGDTVEVAAPAHLTDEELQPIIAKLLKRLERRIQRRDLDDADLQRVAEALNRAHFEGRLRWANISWSQQQNKRYGSCTPADGTIRISHRLATMPAFVLEYVVMHELAHLVEANHGPRFWRLVNRYPKTERARGYLMGVGMEEVEGEEP